MSNALYPSWRRTLGAAALALFAWSCESATAPMLVDGVFVLRTVGGNPVPAVTSVRFGTEFSVLADTVTLRTDSTGRWTSVTAQRNLSSDVSDTTRVVKQFAYDRRGQTVVATGITCGPNCRVSPDEATFLYDGTRLTFGAGASAQFYERIALSTAR